MCEKHVAEQQCLLRLSVLERAPHMVSGILVLYTDLDIDSASGLCVSVVKQSDENTAPLQGCMQNMQHKQQSLIKKNVNMHEVSLQSSSKMHRLISFSLQRACMHAQEKCKREF